MLREEVVSEWGKVKKYFTTLLTKNPSDLLSQINSLETQLIQFKQANPDWENMRTTSPVKSQIYDLEVKKSIVQQKLAYLQNWTSDKTGYEKQLAVMTDKWNDSQKKLDRVRDLISEGRLEKLKELVRSGQL